MPSDHINRVARLSKWPLRTINFLLGLLKYLRFTSAFYCVILRRVMSPLKTFITLLLLSMQPAAAAPRIALVKVKEIYTALPSTIALQEQIKNEREAIMKDERADQLRRIIAELQTLQAQLADKSKDLDESANRKLARNYEIKRQEAQTLQQDFENFKSEQEKSINKKMVASMRAALNRIAGTTQKIAEEKGFDLVMDSSGSTNTGVPFILHSQNSTDLTADIQAAMRDNEPIATQENPVAKPAPTE